MADITPGQIGYAAYRQTFLAYQHHTSGTVMPEPWERLPLLVQICWETAAQALLDAWQAQPRLEEDNYGSTTDRERPIP